MEILIVVVTIVFFIYLIACSSFYLSWRLMKERKYEKKLHQYRQAFQYEIKKQILLVNQQEELSKDDVQTISGMLHQEIYFDLFNEVILDYMEGKNHDDTIAQYMSYFKDFINELIDKKVRKNDWLKVDVAFLIGYYQVKSPKIEQFLLDCLSGNSLYLKLNALTSLAKIGDEQTFYSALLMLSGDTLLFNDKFLIDILEQFGGEKDELNLFLLQSFEQFDYKIQIALINYFTEEQWQQSEALFINILKNPAISKEVQLNIIKYFIRQSNELIKDLLLQYLHHSDWEYRALSAKALIHYPEETVIDELLVATQDKNWYVRLNSAIVLCSFNQPQRLNHYLNTTADNYSKDVLHYAMSLRDEGNGMR